MKPFRFALERVLGWRQSQLELEETRLRQQAAALAGLDRQRAELEALGVRAEVQVRNWSDVAGRDLAALGGFRLYVKARETELEARRAESRQKLAAQQAAAQEARRRFRLLERLKERRLAEWQREADKDLEAVAAEAYLARWNRCRSYNE
jgi:hypothetical protein